MTDGSLDVMADQLKRGHGWVCQIALWVTAALLVVAAAAKAQNPVFFVLGMRSVLGFYPSWWLIGCVIVAEFALAAWLVSGLRHLTAMRVATLVFVLFSLYHLYNLSLDIPRPCGCTGSLWLSILGFQPHAWVESLMAIIPAFLLFNSLALCRWNPPAKA